MTLLEETYTNLKKVDAVRNTDDFSQRFLKRGGSYFRTIRSMNRDPSLETITGLIVELDKQAKKGDRLEGYYKSMSHKLSGLVVAKININNICAKAGFRGAVIAIDRED